MPRKPDIQLETRILNAAYRLWVEQGEHGLTMRAVATAARTTTPTLYERFKDKNALLYALRSRAQQKLVAALQPATSIVELCNLALEFTVAHKHEFQLLARDWAFRLSGKEPTPAFDLMKERLARQLGGAPGDHHELALSLTMLYLGTSMLLLNEGLEPNVAASLRDTALKAGDTLMREADGKGRRRAAD